MSAIIHSLNSQSLVKQAVLQKIMFANSVHLTLTVLRVLAPAPAVPLEKCPQQGQPEKKTVTLVSDSST